SAGGTSCVNFCAFHNATTRTIRGHSNTFAFGVIPDFDTPGCQPAPFGQPGCGDRSKLENTMKSASHELAEAVTDPQPFSGWTGSGGEIGDPCSWVRVGEAAYAPLL